MIKQTVTWGVVATWLCVLAACGTDSGGGGGGGTDAGQTDAIADAEGSDAGQTDGGGADDGGSAGDGGAAQDGGGSADGGGVPGPYGFTLRKPISHSLDCKGISPMDPNAKLQAKETDWVCSLVAGKVDAHVYVQATPAKCISLGMGLGASYQVTGWISQGGAVGPLTKATYDIGGGHQNDSIELEHQSQVYKLYHSSFGFGWRKCQEMDCVQVLEGFAGKVKQDGCTKERTLPIVCREVKPDGTVDELVDLFKPCKGDPNFP